MTARRGGSGEKWFCSVADADQFVVTARPEARRPALRGSRASSFRTRWTGRSTARIRRLKDKLGTRALATGEIEFDGAVAFPLGA